MKQIIVTIGLIILGVIIFNLIIGDDPGTMQSAGKTFMENQIAALSD